MKIGCTTTSEVFHEVFCPSRTTIDFVFQNITLTGELQACTPAQIANSRCRHATMSHGGGILLVAKNSATSLLFFWNLNFFSTYATLVHWQLWQVQHRHVGIALKYRLRV